jgi:hypothetical protein
MELAARLAREDGGVVQTLLVRHTADGPVDRKPVEQLIGLAAREGFEGNVHVAVDRSTAHAVVHGANDLDASLVVVETDFDPTDSPFGIGNWEEVVASTITVPLVLITAGGTGIERVVLGPADADNIDRSAGAFVASLAERIGQRKVVEVDDTNPDWVSALQPGDLGLLAVPTFDLILGLPAPPVGATLAAVPAASLGQWRPN